MRRFTTDQVSGYTRRISITIALVVVLVLFMAGCGLISADSGPEYTPGDATSGTFSVENEATADENYEIAVNPGSFYTMTVSSSTGNIDVFVYSDAEQSDLLTSAESYGSGTEFLTVNTVANDTLYVNLRVWFQEGETSHAYTIDMTEDAP